MSVTATPQKAPSFFQRAAAPVQNFYKNPIVKYGSLAALVFAAASVFVSPVMAASFLLLPLASGVTMLTTKGIFKATKAVGSFFQPVSSSQVDAKTQQELNEIVKNTKPAEKTGNVLCDALVKHMEKSRVDVTTDWDSAKKIIERLPDKFKNLKDKDTLVRGFVFQGKMYLNPDTISPEVEVHEYTHLWAEALRQNNDEEWKKIVGMLKKETTLWEDVKKNYPYLENDNEIADEVLAQYSGRRGGQRLAEKCQNGENPKDVFSSLLTALKVFWGHVANLFDSNNNYNTIDDVADRVLYDLLKGTNPSDYIDSNKITLNDQIPLSQVQNDVAVPVYKTTALEMMGTIRDMVTEVMRENYQEPANAVIDIHPFSIAGIDYDGVTVTGDGYPEILFVSSDSGDTLNLKDLSGRDDILEDVMKNIKGSFYSDDFVKSNADVHSFEAGETVIFRYPSNDSHISGVIQTVGKSWNRHHPFGSDAISVKNKKYFVKDILKDTLRIESLLHQNLSNVKNPIEYHNERLPNLKVKDFDVKVSAGMLPHLDVDLKNRTDSYHDAAVNAIVIRDSKIQSVRGTMYGGFIKSEQSGDYRDDVKPFDIPISELSASAQREIAEMIYSKYFYMKYWSQDVYETQQLQEKSANGKAFEREVNIAMKEYETLDFDKPFGVDQPVGVGVYDMDAIRIIKKGDDIRLSDGEYTLPVTVVPEWQRQDLLERIKAAIEQKEQQVSNTHLKENNMETKVSNISDADFIKLIQPYLKDEYESAFISASVPVHENHSGYFAHQTSQTPDYTPQSLGILFDREYQKLQVVYDHHHTMPSGHDYHTVLGLPFNELTPKEVNSLYDALQNDLKNHGKLFVAGINENYTEGEEVLSDVILDSSLDDEQQALADKHQVDAIDEENNTVSFNDFDDAIYFASENLALLQQRLHSEQKPHETAQDTRYLSDADIHKQYEGFKITGIKFYQDTPGLDSYSGVVDIDFPNANHPDYDNSISNPFIAYDKSGNNIAFDRWMPDDVFLQVRDYIRQERVKFLVKEAIIERVNDPSPHATLTSEQQDVILRFLQPHSSVDAKLQALTSIWHEAEKDSRMSHVYDEWKQDCKEELNDLCSGIRREGESEGVRR